MEQHEGDDRIYIFWVNFPFKNGFSYHFALL